MVHYFAAILVILLCSRSCSEGSRELTICVGRATVKLLDQQLLREMLHKVFTEAADDEERVVCLPDEDVADGQNESTDGPHSQTLR